MSDERKMTISRGLTRIKTARKQLEKIIDQITSYGAWNNKRTKPAC
jgi:hypothetical protein